MIGVVSIDEEILTGYETTGSWTSTDGSDSIDTDSSTSVDPSGPGGTTWDGTTSGWESGESGGGTYGTGGSATGGGETGGTGGDPGDEGESDGGDETGPTCSTEARELNAFVEGEEHEHLADDGGGNGYPVGYPPGWLEKFDLETGTQCNFQNWKDTDGVAPETAGCHHAYEDAKCTTQTNDVFGEYCEDGDVLVESNPGAGVCHSHKIGANGVGVGRPDRFSCSIYCYQSYAVWGNCAATQNTCGNGVDSARCECWF